MQLELNNRKAGMDENVTREAKLQLRFFLSRFNETVLRVKATFSDVNGPKGGLDKLCIITAKMKTVGQITVQNTGHDYIEALVLCLDKLVRAIRRDIDIRRTKPIRKNRMNIYTIFDN